MLVMLEMFVFFFVFFFSSRLWWLWCPWCLQCFWWRCAFRPLRSHDSDPRCAEAGGGRIILRRSAVEACLLLSCSADLFNIPGGFQNDIYIFLISIFRIVLYSFHSLSGSFLWLAIGERLWLVQPAGHHRRQLHPHPRAYLADHPDTAAVLHQASFTP